MSSHFSHMPSPVSEASHRRIRPHLNQDTPPATMLNISALLNPLSENKQQQRPYHYQALPPPTPASTSNCSSPTRRLPFHPPFTPCPPTRQKQAREICGLPRRSIVEPVNYPPFECTEEALCLHPRERHELSLQHRHFRVSPSGRNDEGLIVDYPQSVPYSSEKTDFYGKTGRDAFHYFQYSFTVPDSGVDKQTWLVVWDYQVGLVRITPFFKALGYSKTTPSRAINANENLRGLCPSVTGGVLDVQGYWMPYACARAICLTFCYSIRWALTPIFGPSFIKECVPTDDPRFARFKIDPEVIRCATLEVEGRKLRGTLYEDITANPSNDYPQLRPRKANTNFRLGSPFDSDISDSSYTPPTAESPTLSPKSTIFPTTTLNPSWTSINHFREATAPASHKLADSLLTEPRCFPRARIAPADPGSRPPPTSAPRIGDVPPGSRRRSIPDVAVDVPNPTRQPSCSSSESDDAPLPVPPAPRHSRSASAGDGEGPAVSHKRLRTGRGAVAGGAASKYSDDDRRAARWLLHLHERDARLARESPWVGVGRKRKAE